MQITIDFRSSQPIYTQIVEQIQQMIATGALQPGDQLPTVRQMATDLRVNFNTVARAYRILDESGLISTQQGRGTYIWTRPNDEHSKVLRRNSLEAMAQHLVEQARNLGYDPYETEDVFIKAIREWKENSGKT